MLLNYKQQIEALAIIRRFIKPGQNDSLINIERTADARKWLESVCQSSISQLEQVALLKDDWDSYGGIKPSFNAIHSTREILLVLAKAGVNPHVAPIADGGIQLDFEDGSELEINASGQPEKYLNEGDN